MANQDIAFIVNSFNRFDLLQQCIGALSSWIPGSGMKDRCAVVVYEAGSTDGSLEWLIEEKNKLSFPLEILIPSAGDDTSFAAGLNAGVRHAEKLLPSLRYLVFYETDNKISTELPLLQALHQIENTKQLGACGFTVQKHNGSPAGVGMPFPTIRNFMLGAKLVQHFQLEKIVYQWTKNDQGVFFSPVDVVYTSPLLVRLDAWKQSGGLDEAVFPFSDCDIDWAKRFRKVGWFMGVIKVDNVIHDNRETLSNWSKSRAVQFHRGRLRYFLRHHSISMPFLLSSVLMIRHLMELIIVKVTVKNKTRQEQLVAQQLGLLKSCFKKYELK